MTATRFFLAENLACARGERAVFRDVSLRVEDGGALVLRGPNGTGKSSLLRMLAGLLPPFAGHLAWHDGPVDESPDRHAARLVYLGHANAAQPALTVQENLSFWAHLQPDGQPQRIGEALDAFALSDLAEPEAGMNMTMSHVAARSEVRALLRGLKLPVAQNAFDSAGELEPQRGAA